MKASGTWRRLAAVLAASSGSLLLAAMASAQGDKPIYVQYEGFIKEPDGSMVLSFGYFNTNDADVEIAAGADNRFHPDAPDRGQPTTFRKGRQRSACVMRVAEGFDGQLQWSVTHGGYVSTTSARVLDPLYALEETSGKRALSAFAKGSELPGRCLTASEKPRS